LNRNVFFRGEIPYTAVASEMRLSHAFILFSDSETFSCVTAEALCCGLPVIASNVGALPELVNLENGRLVESKDVEQLAQAMKEVLDNYVCFDSNVISKRATEQYGYAAVAERFRKLYERESSP
jgi:glycosyltransferase involved in cell wall biosynthesis